MRKAVFPSDRPWSLILRKVECQQTDADPETGCMEFDIEKDGKQQRGTAGRQRGGIPREQRRRQSKMM